MLPAFFTTLSFYSQINIMLFSEESSNILLVLLRTLFFISHITASNHPIFKYMEYLCVYFIDCNNSDQPSIKTLFAKKT